MAGTLGIQHDNLELIHRHAYTARAARGAKFIEESTDHLLAVTLDSHLIREPSATAIRRRDDIDFLLSYYSILELACRTGYIAATPPKAITQRALIHLQEPNVRRYYERYYPLLLPQAFRERLTTTDNPPPVPCEQLFEEFLTVNALRDDPDVEQFLWFVDDGTDTEEGEEYGLSDALLVLRKPKRLVKAMTTPRDAADFALRGMMRFLRFSRELYAFLEHVENPVMRSAFWHYHAYWFLQIGGQVLGVMTVAIEELRSYVAKNKMTTAELHAATTTYESMDAATRELQLLTTGRYRVALEDSLLSHPANVKIKRDNRLDGLQVLLVDDDRSMLRLLRYHLQHSGATVFIAESLPVAYELLETHPIDLIISDIAIGAGAPSAGFSLIKGVRQRRFTTPVIGISSYHQDPQRIVDAGFELFIKKQDLKPELLAINVASVPQVLARLPILRASERPARKRPKSVSSSKLTP